MKLENMTGAQRFAVKHDANRILRGYIGGLTKFGDVYGCIEILKCVDRTALAQLLVATLKASEKIQDSDCDVEFVKELSQYIDFNLPKYFHTQCILEDRKAEITLTACYKQIGFHYDINVKLRKEQYTEVFKHRWASAKQQELLKKLAKQKKFVLLKPPDEYTMYEVNQVVDYAQGKIARKTIATLIGKAPRKTS